MRTEPWCPTCILPLTSRVHERSVIWSCGRCEGVFLPAQELRTIVAEEAEPRSDDERRAAMAASAAGPAPDELEQPPTECPWCATAMTRSNYGGDSGVLIDRCDACGIWLDGGELERIEAWAEAARAGMVARAPSPPRSALGSDGAPRYEEFQEVTMGSRIAMSDGVSDGLLIGSVVDAVLTERSRRRREQEKERDLLAWAEQQRSSDR